MSKHARQFVDAHLHLWNSRENPWYAFPVPGGDDFGMNLALPREFRDPFLLDDYLAALAPAQVTKCVHVTAVISPDFAEQEGAWVSAIARERGLPNAIIGTVDTQASASQMEALLDRERSNPLYRGARVLAGLDYESTIGAAVLDALERRDLIYDAVAHPGGGIAALARALRNKERLSVVLEHTGWPLSEDADTFKQWRTEMEELSRLPNVNCKLSGLAMVVHRTELESFRRYFDVCINLFGTERCMFGSNFPVDLAYGEFPGMLDVFERVAAEHGPDGVDDLFERTAERVYKI